MKRVAILGAGFGGLRSATQLSKKLKALNLLNDYEVLLIDRNDHHTYTPLLYEVATTSKETANLPALHEIAAYRLENILKRFPIRFIRGEITSLDVVNGTIYLNQKIKIEADYILLALGSEANYFNIRGLEKYALPFKTFTDAIRVRDAVWNLALTEKKEIQVVIGGAGPSGVELAGEFKAWEGELRTDFPGVVLNVQIIEAKSTVLGEFSPRIIERVMKRLQKLGVTIRTNERVDSVTKNQAVLQSGEKAGFDIFVWAGGVKAPQILANLPLEEADRNQVKVVGGMGCLPQTPHLKLHSRIYAIGDNACFYDPKTGKPMPGVARAAISQANIAAHNIVEDIKRDEGLITIARHKTYEPMQYPYIIPVGGKYAIAEIGPIVISGFFGWILKGLVEVNYLLSIMPTGQAIKIWLKGLNIFVQNDRLG